MELIKSGNTYSVTIGCDKINKYGIYTSNNSSNTPLYNVTFTSGMFDLDTRELTSMMLNLGKELLKFIGNKLQNVYIDFKNHDLLKQELISYDLENHLIIEGTIIKWYKNNIYPFNDFKIDEYTFGALCIRLYAIVKCFNKAIVRKDFPSSFESKQNGKHRSDLYFVFNDYIIKDMNENDYSKYIAGNKRINHKIDNDTIIEYAIKLFNDINEKYNIWIFTKNLIFSKDKENEIISYYLSPISAVYNLIAELLCNRESHIKVCEECGYYMKVDNLHKKYHDECYFIVDSKRKKNDSK